MDPNGGKKRMFNKLNKEQTIAKLERESFKRKTISFYRYVVLENLLDLRDKLYFQWEELDVLGRISCKLEAKFSAIMIVSEPESFNCASNSLAVRRGLMLSTINPDFKIPNVEIGY